MRCGACSSNASTVAGFATSTTWNSVSSRSGVASTRTSLTEQFNSGVFDYAHVSVQMAASLSTICNWHYCVRTTKATFPYWKLPFLSSIFKQLLLRNCVVDFVEICNICANSSAKRIFNSHEICRSCCDFYFGVPFLEHSVVPAMQPNNSSTTTVLQPFFLDYPGESMPEENFWTLSSSSSSQGFLKWPKQQRHHEDHYSQSKYRQYQSVL